MKKLSESDLALLKARGKVTNGFSTKRDNEVSVPKGVKKVNYVKLHEKAHAAGLKAADACVPTPMVVAQHANMLDDNSPVVKAWHVPGGVCGFAWVNVKCKTSVNRKFIAAMKKAGTGWRKDGYYGGYTYWVSVGGQSMETKIAYANAYMSVLEENGVTGYVNSRMD